MRVSSIQPALYNQTKKTQINKKIYSNPINVPSTNPQFKGSGDGALAGLGFGLCGGLIAIGGAAVAGIFLLPAIIGGAAVVAAGAAGAYVGDKIEDKITKNKNK